MLRSTLILIMSAAFLTGCQTDEGEKFLGSWQNAKRASERLAIEQNGKSYLITVTRKTCFTETNCKDIIQKASAVLEADRLVVREGSNQINVVIDEKTGSLLANGTEYNRGVKTE